MQGLYLGDSKIAAGSLCCVYYSPCSKEVIRIVDGRLYLSPYPKLSICGSTYSLPRSTMGLRVVSTELSDEEHTKLLEFCNRDGCTPSALIKQAIKEKLETVSKTEKKTKKLSEINSVEELAEVWFK